MVTSKNSFKDRSVRSGHTPDRDIVNLEVLANCVVEGKEYTAGQILEVSRAEAKRLISLDKKLFKVSLD